jgi:hypothetical protein
MVNYQVTGGGVMVKQLPSAIAISICIGSGIALETS